MISKRKLFTNKKAIGAEIDWIIAGGIFLIYLLMTLVYFKPGLNPVHNPQNLLDIVQDGFESYDVGAYWQITTQPMFVEAIPFTITVGTDTKPASMAPSNSPEQDDHNANGNSLCVEFKGDVGSNTPDSFPLKLESDKTKIFFVGDTIEETKKDMTGSKRDSLDCLDINNEINNLDSLMRGVVGQGYGGSGGSSGEILDGGFGFIGQRGIVCDSYLISDCDTFPDTVDEEGIVLGNSEKADCKQCKQWNDAKKELENKKQSINPPCTPSDDTSNVEIKTETIEKKLKEGYLNFYIDAYKNLRFIPYFTDKKTKYILTYSDSTINFENKRPGGCEIEPNKDPACIIKDSAEHPSCHAKYELGVSETIKGISLAKFRGLAATCTEDAVNGYNCRKNIWGYPALKDFKIRVYTKEDIIAEFPKEPIIPTNINVYSRQFNTFILNEDGLREAVTVNILVW